MKYKKIDDAWVIVLARGEKVIEKLTEFAKAENIQSGYFHGLGAISAVELAHYNVETKSYSVKSMEQLLEIINLTGNVARKESEIIIHAHVVAGTDKMEVYGGHLKEAVVAATCEVIFNEFQEPIHRKYDGDIGLNLMELK